MSIPFAATNAFGRFPMQPPISRSLVRRAKKTVANDNDDNALSDHMLRAALRHFAEHGLGAARAARAQAEQAFFAGDRQSYEWWLGITRTLDRRLAADAEQVLPPQELLNSCNLAAPNSK